MAKQPFLPLFFGDLLASTATWDGEERALYILLLAYQWTAGPLPNDTRRLARMAQYDHAVFSRLWETVGRKFVRAESGLVNQRLEEHRAKAVRIAEINEGRARNAAGKRWSNAPSITPSNAPSITPRNAPEMPSNPIQSIPIHKKVPSEPSTAASPPWLADFQAVYPKRGGDQNWRRAASAGEARIREGHTSIELIDGARRYAEYIRATGKEGTEYVKQAATFLGRDKAFLEPWSLPLTKADARYTANIETARKWAEG